MVLSKTISLFFLERKVYCMIRIFFVFLLSISFFSLSVKVSALPVIGSPAEDTELLLYGLESELYPGEIVIIPIIKKPDTQSSISDRVLIYGQIIGESVTGYDINIGFGELVSYEPSDIYKRLA